MEKEETKTTTGAGEEKKGRNWGDCCQAMKDCCSGQDENSGKDARRTGCCGGMEIPEDMFKMMETFCKGGGKK